ncbi:hypothetical protein RJ639_022445 [Escallonia herrerae]|uniref:Leucine-rich repeat-containing N-terminal plant-type domain-containing protein n=1 Tax=Escallonia herrerae TaxID=1293975 RepID=A0AA89AFA7_9ASTE|nr:hypothetical protein RJ639_022445 [Escallonia herrerae]
MSRPWAVSVICIFSLVHCVAHSKTLKRDVKALNEIKSLLGWRVVYAWVGDDPCGDNDLPPWAGVKCSTMGDYRVVTDLSNSLNILVDGFSFRFAHRISDHREVFAVSIIGPFPTAVTNMLDLTRLDLHNNKLTGPIPPQIGRLKRLRVLNLRWNKLQDIIPPEIGELKQLTHLFIIIVIPIYWTWTALLALMTHLYVDNNQFSGRIPDAFYKHPFLEEMYIEGNGFRLPRNASTLAVACLHPIRSKPSNLIERESKIR